MYSGGLSFHSDYSIFFKKYGECNVFVVVYVDDIIMTRTDLVEIQSLEGLFA